MSIYHWPHNGTRRSDTTTPEDKPLPKGCDYQGRHPEAQHGTECCADTSDDASVYASGWVHALVYGTSSAVSLLAVAVMAGWL